MHSGRDIQEQGFDIERIRQEAFVARVEHRRCVTSTNDWARQLAADPRGELPLLLLAEGQTAGRGRGANRWWTGPGSLAMSLLLDAGQAGVAQRSQTPLIGLAAALAVTQAVGPLVAPRPACIRWPNDVFAAGKKLAGVLVEVLPKESIVVGIGVNTNNALGDAPPELRSTATTLRELTGQTQDQTGIVIAILRHLEVAFGQLASEPERIGRRAHEWCLQRGETLSVEVGRQVVTGRCAGIAPDGALLVDTAEGLRTVQSGIVHQG